MRQFKNKLLALFSLTLLAYFSSCHLGTKQKITSAGLQMTACLGGEGDFYYADSNRAIFISTTLYNPTNDTIHFLTMTCNYADFYLTNKSDFKVDSRQACFLDGLSLMTLPPQKKIDRFVVISPAKNETVIIDSTIRIGMYYMAFKNERSLDSIMNTVDINNAIKSFDSLMKSRPTAKVIWSNEIELNRLNGQIY